MAALIGMPLVIASIRLNWRQPLVFYVSNSVSDLRIWRNIRKILLCRVISNILYSFSTSSLLSNFLLDPSTRNPCFDLVSAPDRSRECYGLVLLLSLQPLKTTLKNAFRRMAHLQVLPVSVTIHQPIRCRAVGH